MAGKGNCKHGEFDLDTGCPQCIAERRAVAQEAEATGHIPEDTNVLPMDAESTAETDKPLCEGTGGAPPSVGGTADISEAGDEVFGHKIKVEEELQTALALRPGEDVEARGYFEEALKALKHAEARVIASVEDVKVATDDLSLIAKLKKVMENKRRSLLDPLKLQAEAIRETYSSLMDPIFRADRITRDKILGFNQEQEHRRLEQEDINRKRLEAAEAEMRLKGELSESVNLVEVAPETPKKVSTDMGTSGQRDNWKWEVVDFALLPDEYKVVDSSMLTAVAKGHHDQKQVPGVRFYNEPIIAVRAR